MNMRTAIVLLILFMQSIVLLWGQQAKPKGSLVRVTKTIDIADKKLHLEIWDNNREDSDSVSLSLNGDWILENERLTKAKKELFVELSQNENVLVLHALNLGAIPPNTATIAINGREVTLSSDYDKSTAIRLTVKDGAPKNKAQYTIEMSDIDDVARCFINGKEIAVARYGKEGINEQWKESAWRGESGIVDVSSYIKNGKNSIRFTLENEHCCAALFSYQFKKNDAVLFKGEVKEIEGQEVLGVLWEDAFEWFEKK